MSIPVTITLNSIVGVPGPFSLYSNTDSYVTPFETGVLLSSLQTGYGTSNVPNGTTNIKIKSTGGSCSYEITKPISGLPATPTPTPTPSSTPLPPTPTTTDGYTHLTVKSGTTTSSACNGVTINVKYSGAFAYDTTILRLEDGTPVPDNYYYVVDGDYAGVVWIVDSVCMGCTHQAGNVHNLDICPTATPTTGTVLNAVVSLVDGSTACSGGDYDSDPLTPGTIEPMFFNLTIYGSNIVNASGIIDIPAFLLADFTTNQEFYVRGRVAPDFYWKKFILNGDPSGGATTANASGLAELCVVPTPTPLPGYCYRYRIDENSPINGQLSQYGIRYTYPGSISTDNALNSFMSGLVTIDGINYNTYSICSTVEPTWLEMTTSNSGNGASIPSGVFRDGGTVVCSGNVECS